jgi:uncharacterized beta-barrel protein YwiB (DUF1934 family)
MEKSVIISIHGTQTDPDGVNEEIELVTRGSLSGTQEQGYHLTYQESELTGLEGTTTTFCIGEDQITMLRTGSLNSEMVFREGQRHVSLYETGYGGLMIGVNTQKAWADIGQDGGNMELRYVVEIENTVVGKNTFRIQVRDPAMQTL